MSATPIRIESSLGTASSLGGAAYTILIGVPFRRISERVCEVASDWGESLRLLRDSLEGQLGPLVVGAPRLYDEGGMVGEQAPVALDSLDDEIEFFELGNYAWRARDFWRHYPAVRRAVRQLAARASVVHAGINDVWQPWSLLGFYAGIRAGVPAVFVLDRDIVRRQKDLMRDAPLLQRARSRAYSSLYATCARRAVSRADLTLLKGAGVYGRYRKFARNARNFYNTSYQAEDVVPSRELEAKCRRLRSGEPLRLLSLGRLMDFKRVDHTLRAVIEAASRGARVTLDVIGGGPEEARLRGLVASACAERYVRFLGPRAYGSELLGEIAGYHLLLFTSQAEDTPRSLFDGIAGGLGLLAYESTYSRELVAGIAHGAVVSKGDIEGLGVQLCELDRDRSVLERWMRNAASCAPEHAAEVWYQRRAQWTLEAVSERRKLENPRGVSSRARRVWL